MFCKNCGVEMADNQAICVACGVKTGDGNKFCANCGKETAPDAAVCLNCGVEVKKAGGDLAGQDKIVIALICFFLGGLGIHNFMMGETKKGVFKILLTTVGSLLCGIGPIVCAVFVIMEFIKILTDKYIVDPNKLI